MRAARDDAFEIVVDERGGDRPRGVGGGGRDVVPDGFGNDPREADVREAIEAGP